MAVKLPEMFLFEAFAKFLSERENFDNKKEYYRGLLVKQNIEPTKVNTFHCYVGQNLLNRLGAKTVANHFSGKPIEDDRFKFFCEKFEKIFDGLSDDEKNQYEAINVAFTEWRNGIYKSKEWDIPNITDICSSTLVPTKKENELEVNNDEFKKAIDTISIFFDNNESIFPIEKFSFKHLQKLLEDRLYFLNFKESVYLDFTKLIIKLITNSPFELYELESNKIIRRIIDFDLPSITDYGFKFTFLYPINTEKGVRRLTDCYFNYFNNSFYIHNPYTESFIEEYFVFTIARKVMNFDRASHYLIVGNKLTFNKKRYHGEAKIAVLNQINKLKADNPRYYEFDKNDETVPDNIRAILLFPSSTAFESHPFLEAPLLWHMMVDQHTDREDV